MKINNKMKMSTFISKENKKLKQGKANGKWQITKNHFNLMKKLIQIKS